VNNEYAKFTTLFILINIKYSILINVPGVYYNNMWTKKYNTYLRSFCIIVVYGMFNVYPQNV